MTSDKKKLVFTRHPSPVTRHSFVGGANKLCPYTRGERSPTDRAVTCPPGALPRKTFGGSEGPAAGLLPVLTAALFGQLAQRDGEVARGPLQPLGHGFELVLLFGRADGDGGQRVFNLDRQTLGP